MRAAFRLDAGQELGVGHAARCSSLAEDLSKLGFQTTFVCTEQTVETFPRLRNVGDRIAYLDPSEVMRSQTPYVPGHGCGVLTDAGATCEALGSGSYDWMVVDHYAVDERWERKVAAQVGSILVVDDLMDRRHACDFILNQSMVSSGEYLRADLVSETTTVLTGPKYALLSEPFLQRKKPDVRNALRRVLVSFGGVDHENATEPVVMALGSWGRRGVEVDVAIGSSHPEAERITALCDSLGFKCHLQSPRIERLMANADLAVGAAGTSSWERCRMGLPTVIFTTAANQRRNAEGLEEAGACVDLGSFEAFSESRLLSVLNDLTCEPDRLKLMSAASFALLDEHVSVADLMTSANRP